MHFFTPNWLPNTESCAFVCQCYEPEVTARSPPLLFNLATDPGERRPCTREKPCAGEDYDAIVDVVNAEAARFKAEVAEAEVESQYALKHFFPRPWLQPCCNFPRCNCREEDTSNVT